MEFIIETGLYRPRVKFFAMFEVVQHNLYSKHATKLMNELLGKTKQKKRGCTYGAELFSVPYGTLIQKWYILAMLLYRLN